MRATQSMAAQSGVGVDDRQHAPAGRSVSPPSRVAAIRWPTSSEAEHRQQFQHQPRQARAGTPAQTGSARRCGARRGGSVSPCSGPRLAVLRRGGGRAGSARCRDQSARIGRPGGARCGSPISHGDAARRATSARRQRGVEQDAARPRVGRHDLPASPTAAAGCWTCPSVASPCSDTWFRKSEAPTRTSRAEAVRGERSFGSSLAGGRRRVAGRRGELGVAEWAAARNLAVWRGLGAAAAALTIASGSRRSWRASGGSFRTSSAWRACAGADRPGLGWRLAPGRAAGPGLGRPRPARAATWRAAGGGEQQAGHRQAPNTNRRGWSLPRQTRGQSTGWQGMVERARDEILARAV